MRTGSGTPEDPWVEYTDSYPVEIPSVLVTIPDRPRWPTRYETHRERRFSWQRDRIETWIDPATEKLMGRKVAA